MSSAVLNINSENWKTYVKRATSPNSYMRQLMRAWVVIYLADMQRRYKESSRGGGQWPPIKKGTAKNKGNDLILIQTGRLMKALQIGSRGAKMKRLAGELAVEVGFSQAQHGKSGLTYNQLARIHQNGEGDNPVREILVPPSEQAMRQMVHASEVMFDKMSADLKGG